MRLRCAVQKREGTALTHWLLGANHASTATGKAFGCPASDEMTLLDLVFVQ